MVINLQSARIMMKATTPTMVAAKRPTRNGLIPSPFILLNEVESPTPAMAAAKTIP